jgi:vitamin B12 transporter
MEASESSAGFQSNYVLDYIGDKIDASVGIEGPGELRLDARWSWQDRVGGYNNRATGEEFEYDPFSLLSFTVSKTFSDLQLRSYLRMDNALDVSYVDIGNVNQPGRWIRIGFAYNFD